MIAVRSLLMSGQSGPHSDAIATSVFYTPELRADAAVEVVYKLLIESIVGAPSTASLRVAFQACQRTTGGASVGHPTAVTDALPKWATITEDEHRGLLPDGDWPTHIADQTLAAPRLIIRRIRGGFSNRLAITPAYSGGTDPAFVMTLEAIARYT